MSRMSGAMFRSLSALIDRHVVLVVDGDGEIVTNPTDRRFVAVNGHVNVEVN